MKNQETTLKINSTDGYLHLEDLPHNCIFNKVITGCGGTTIAITNSENYVIAVPTKELIVNKIGKSDAGESDNKNLFGLFGGFDNTLKSKLKKYLKKDGVKKIICTYDKLAKLSEYLNPADFRLLVDEYHCLLKAYSYRDAAIDGVLDSFKQYKSFCFMSATPIQAEFSPSCLNGVPVIVADWSYTDTLIVSLEKTNHPYQKASNYIKAYKRDGYIEINGKKSYEAFFFINSVTDIKAILDHCDLANNEVRIICADTESNRSKLEGFEISNSISDNKMFTFITCKGFEGVDYFSDTAMSFVVSSTSNPHTLAAIDTDIPQIAGRIRTKTNPFRNLIVHIFNTQLDTLNLSYEEMKERTEKELEAAKETANMFNTAPDIVKDHLRDKLKDKVNDMYISYDKKNDAYKVNDILPKLELYNYQVNKVIYSSGLQIAKGYDSNGILHTSVNWELVDNEIIKKKGMKLTFEEAYKEYSLLKKDLVITPKIEELEKQFPLLIPAYHKLGNEAVKRLKYVQKAIRNELLVTNDYKSLDNKIFKIIKEDIHIGEFIPAKKAKELLKRTYELVGKKETAKATDLNKWFEIDAASKRIDGKKVAGYVIVRSKIIFK